MNDRYSEETSISFQHRKIRLPLDVVVVAELPEHIWSDDVESIKFFMESLAAAFDTSSSDLVRWVIQ